MITYLSFKLAEKFKEDMPVLGKMTDSLLSPPEEDLSERQRHYHCAKDIISSNLRPSCHESCLASGDIGSRIHIH